MSETKTRTEANRAKRHRQKTNRAERDRIERAKPLGLTLDAHITSPRLIANGNGAWEGTLRELLELDWVIGGVDRAGEVVGRMIADGRIVDVPRDEDGFVAEEYEYPMLEQVVHLLGYGDIEDLLDDPNVAIAA
ncbi:hypothetical protein [Mycobacterium sp. 155]|uniref:hypothetical protein n=1 Tax=Mycobacterium sp. 155 TaxID=1157943 RepID=UPI00037EEAD7|nr:hypothetical protein [Mycobacterium sp. 155]